MAAVISDDAWERHAWLYLVNGVRTEDLWHNMETRWDETDARVWTGDVRVTRGGRYLARRGGE